MESVHYIDKPAKMDYILPESGSLVACLIKGKLSS